jgi:3-phenylpropionate/trans-cinnamate dioxygenase ferredoxin subunit
LTRYRVCRFDELEVGRLKAVEIDNIAVVLARTPDGQVRALRDTCPHMGARLSHGLLFAAFDSADVDDYRLAEDRFVIRCPWHGYEFDVEDGRCLGDPTRVRVRAYPVSVQDGEVWVERP